MYNLLMYHDLWWAQKGLYIKAWVKNNKIGVGNVARTCRLLLKSLKNSNFKIILRKLTNEKREKRTSFLHRWAEGNMNFKSLEKYLKLKRRQEIIAYQSLKDDWFTVYSTSPSTYNKPSPPPLGLIYRQSPIFSLVTKNIL